MINSLFKNKKNIIPFKNDLLFNFFNKKTQITDTYLLDPVSALKLYPKKSGAVKPTALSTGIKLPNAEIDLIGKVEVFFHHKLADAVSGYIWGGENTAGPNYATTGLYLNGVKTAYYAYYKGSTPAALNTSALQDDNYYIFTTDFTQATVKIVANKVTIVNNALVVGSNINGAAQAKGTQELTTDIGILSARNNTAYVVSSKHKVIWVKIYDKQGVLMHEFNFSEGAGEQTFDVVTGNAYPISNINLDPTAFWNYTQDFNHYNFKYGFTLYQKTGSADIRIPNKKDGSEITPVSVPSGYSRVANYKECRLTFNQCENVFVLDDVSAGSTDLTVSGAGDNVLNGDYHVYDVYDGKNRYIDNTIGDYTHFLNWYAGAKRWNWGVWGGSVLFYSTDNVATPDLVTTWNATSGTLPIGTITAQGPSDLYNADVDFVLFTESTGVAKELTIQDIYSDVVDSTLDRGHLYINSDSNKNMMLYKTDKGVDTPEDLKIWAYVEK